MRFLRSVYSYLASRYEVPEDARVFFRKICSLFVAYGARLNQTADNSFTLAHVAAYSDDVELLRMYAEHGGEVDTLCPSMVTPLNIALDEK